MNFLKGLDLADAVSVIARGRNDSSTTHENLAQQVVDTVMQQVVEGAAATHRPIIQSLQDKIMEFVKWFEEMPSLPSGIGAAKTLQAPAPATLADSGTPLDPGEAYQRRTGQAFPAATSREPANQPTSPPPSQATTQAATQAATQPAAQPAALAPQTIPRAPGDEAATPAPEGHNIALDVDAKAANDAPAGSDKTQAKTE